MAIILIDTINETIFQNGPVSPGSKRLIVLDVLLLISWYISSKMERVASFLFFGGFYISFFLYPMFPEFYDNPVDDLFVAIFLMIVMSALVLVFYDLKKDIVFIVIWNALFYITAYFTTNNIIERLDPIRYGSVIRIFENQPLMFFGYIGAGIFLLLVVMKLKSNNEQFKEFLNTTQLSLQKQQKVNSNQNKQLELRRNELTQLRDELAHANDALELKVEQRTNALKELNKKVIDHGFLHTDEILIPVRHLQKIVNSGDGTVKENRGELKKTAEEIDLIIREINEVLKSIEHEIV